MSNPKQVVADVFEQLKGQASHTGQAVKQEPAKMVNDLLGEPDEGADEVLAGNQQQPDPQRQAQQQQVMRLRQLDERRRQEHLAALRKQQRVMQGWEMERKKRDYTKDQETAERRREEQRKSQKKEIRQLEKREKREVLSVTRAKTQVEVRLGKF